jgi:hypothetical protein
MGRKSEFLKIGGAVAGASAKPTDRPIQVDPMKFKSSEEVERFVQHQKDQLGLSDSETDNLRRSTMVDLPSREEEEETDSSVMQAKVMGAGFAQAAAPAPLLQVSVRKKEAAMADPYLPESQTIKVRPTKVSKIRSLWYEHALPNEYIMEIGRAGAKPSLGGKFLKLGKEFLKFPAAVQTVYFTSDNANKNYQGLKIDGYACWRVDPERPELAAQTLDFSDQENPMGNTNRILRTICTEAIRHLIANISISDALTKKDEIGRDLKAQLGRIERTWGILFDQVGIERVTILSSRVFDDLQQQARDDLRLTAAESRMRTDQEIEKKHSAYTEEMERLKGQTEKETRILRAATESEIHKVELDEKARREAEERRAAEEKAKAEAEVALRTAEALAKGAMAEATRDAEVEAHREAERRRLEGVKAQSEAEIQTQKAAIEAQVIQARTQAEMANAQVLHDQALKAAELETLRREAQEAANQRLDTQDVAASLERNALRNDAAMKERRDTIELDHKAETRRLERFRVEEDIRNQVAANRIRVELMERLPSIAQALKVDRYTVLDSGGGSPLDHFLNRVMAFFDDKWPPARTKEPGDSA